MGRPSIFTTEPIPEPEAVARVFRALGDRTRVRIVDYLRERESATQIEVIRELGLSQTRVAQHLSVLVWGGFVDFVPQGNYRYYRLVTSHGADLLQIARAFLATAPEPLGGTPIHEE